MKRERKSCLHPFVLMGKLLRELRQLYAKAYFLPQHQRQNKWEWVTPAFQDYVEAHLVPRNTTYSQIGVGVYQGEAIVLRKWAFGTSPHQWMVYKLPDLNLSELPSDISQSLRCLASLLEQYKKQPSLWKNNLQTIGEQKLTQWYPEQIHCGYKLPASQDAENNLAIGLQLQPQKEQSQSKTEQLPRCSGCPYCSPI